MNPKEQYIYNTYLKVSRSRQNKPFRFRHNFKGFEDNPNYIFVKKLNAFFNKHTNINIDDYFNAPYNVYDDDQFYDLKFYTTPKCIRLYGLYIKKLDMEDPDSDHQIQRIKDSLLFVYTFCRDNGIQLNEYLDHKSGDIPTFILHLREREVTIYSLCEFDNFDAKFRSVPYERLKFTLGEHLAENVNEFKLKYYKSKKAKQILNKGKQKIQTLLNNNNKSI